MKNAYSNVPLFNQRVWDAKPERAEEVALDAIATGGFDTSAIDRRVGNYEGQIMAIRRGWLDEDGRWSWVINDQGIAALKAAGRAAPTFLPAVDTWHGSTFEYCAYNDRLDDAPALRLFRECIPAKGCVGMRPRLRYSDVAALHEFLGQWLAENK